jgi:hypothetical protein
MTPKQVHRLYDGLTPTEQANMVFAAVARRDTAEAETILSRVEIGSYRATHADYRRQLLALQALASVYGLEYWKVRAVMLYACETAGAEEAAERFLQKTLALEVALVDICDRFNVDITAIKTMAQCLDTEAAKQPLPRAAADTELVAQYDAMLTEVFESWR